MGHRLQIKTLGGLSIAENGQAMGRFASRKAEALLVYLACTRRSHPREVLADMLWDERTQPQALANLRVVLSGLRKEVGPFISITRSTARINGDAEVWLDVAQLEKAVEALQKGQEPPSTGALEALEDALALYQGDFLAGFFLPEASGFEAWASGERERLHRLALDAMQRLGRTHLGRGDYAAAIAMATRLVQLDPLAEVGHRQLMEALARKGQRAEALAQYETSREILAEELGLEPEAETQALREAIRQGRLGTPDAFALLDAAATPVLPDFLVSPPAAPVHEIPFLARREVLARMEYGLQRALEEGARPTFVSGEAGMGKTALVQEFARRASAAAPKLIVAHGHCSTLAAGGGTYQPFRQIVAMLCGDVAEAVPAGDLEREQARRLWQLMPLTAQAIVEEGPNLPGAFFNGRSLLTRLASALPERVAWLARLERVVEEAGTAPGEMERSALHDQLAAVLRALAREHPLLLILEDLHWAEQSTIDLLFQLLRGLRASPILFLANFRPEEVQGPAPDEQPLLEKVLAECKRDFGNVVVDLDGVGGAERRAFVDEVVDIRPNELGETFRQALYRRTRGHALFTIELLRALRQRGDLERDEEGLWRVAAKVDWTELPAHIEGVLEERLARLPAALRELLDVAAIEGETFTAQVIAGTLGQDERQVVRLLSGPLEREHLLVQSLGTRRLGRKRRSRFRFRHELFRQFLYNSLQEVERSYLHEDVGRTLEKLYEGHTEDIAGQLAWHFTEAGLDEKGLRYSLQAGDIARLNYGNEEAIRHYENALVFLREENDPARVARTLMKLGLTYQMALEHRRARLTFEEGFAAWQRAESGEGRRKSPPAPHPFRELYSYEPETLDPTRARSELAVRFLSQLFSGLAEKRFGTELVPGVAQRWELEDDGRTVIFHLRQNARWSDGHSLTAMDFVLAWRRQLDPARSTGITNTELYDIKGARSYARGEVSSEALGVQVVNPHTLAVELERPSGPFLNVAHYPIPAHVVQRHGAQWAAPEYLVSNGPFTLHNWYPQQEITFERNPHYHEHYAGNVEHIKYKYVDDGPTAVELYENGKLDVLDSSLLSLQQFGRVRRRFAADYVSAPILQTIVLCFDLDRAPFHDARVRQALALAIDRQNLADVRLGGLFFPADGGMVPTGMAGYTPNINLSHAPQKARRLLAQAGYADGSRFPEVVAYGQGEGLYAMAREAVQAQWRRVLGLDIDIQPRKWSDQVEGAHLNIAGWITDVNADPSYFLETFVRDWSYRGKHKALDGLLIRARETADPQDRLALYQRADRLLVQEVLLSPLLYGRVHYFIRPWVRGYLPPKIGGRWRDLVIEPH